MGNVFQTEALLHRKFDLKGSTHGRTAGARATSPAAVLKARACVLHGELAGAWRCTAHALWACMAAPGGRVMCCQSRIM